ncbi:MAG: helix-turn-helix domain-containing protein [Verrucomicrobia bacterium]|jgi:AraC-like DNA-binding protein|nr:helix-turn-helix domain-containing protein [Verrucomicrobiota bacterium]MBT7068361.1 helix-turn-helix domain-containing protein [Verrucomicrobiota bacterium]MBT7698936.1 helix-turn-helix domain-containing protein [Verrucomicrobiota bacterium]
MDKPHIFSFALPAHEITEELSEQVGHDNPLAVEVAGPLFDAGVQFAAITERPEFLRAEPWPRPWHTFYLVIQGELHMTTGAKTYTWQAGDLAFCPAGVPFRRTGLPGQPVRWLYIRLHDIPAWEPLKQHGFTSSPYESADLLFLLLRRVLDAHRYRSAELIALAHSHARALVDLLRHEITLSGHPPQPYTVPLQQLMAEIQQNPSVDWNSSVLAKRLNVSTRKLYRIFNTEYGMPPKEMVIKQRIAQAAEQLARTTTPIGKIAESLGYQSLYSFSNLFKKHTGMRPTAYRKKFEH